MARDNTPFQDEAQRSSVAQVAAVLGEVALCFGEVLLRLVFFLAPAFAVLIEGALTGIGPGGPDIAAPLDAALTDIRAWILGFSMLWWSVVGLWWIFHYPMDPEHHDFEWYATHVGFAVFGLYAWALVPAVAGLTVAVFPTGSV